MGLITKLISTYKINLLISLILSVVIIALRLERDVLRLGVIIFGSLLGTFMLDFEYFLTSYLLSPETEFAKGLRDLLNQKNYVGAISYIEANKHSVPDSITHSAMFQLIALVLAFYVSTSSGSLFALSFAVSVFAQTIYQMYEDYSEKGSAANWFWVLKEKPTRKAQGLYLTCLLVGLLYVLSLVS